MLRIAVCIYIGKYNHVCTKFYKGAEIANTKDFNSYKIEPLIITEYWLKNIEEYFHLHITDNTNLYEKLTTNNVTNSINTTVKHVKYTEQGTIEIQDKFTESYNDMVKKSIIID